MPVPTLEFAALALRNADLLLARLTVTDPQEGVITFLLFNFKRNKKKQATSPMPLDCLFYLPL